MKEAQIEETSGMSGERKWNGEGLRLRRAPLGDSDGAVGVRRGRSGGRDET